MKKFALIAVALCVACLMAAPAGALEITTDGYYRAQYNGIWNTEMTSTGDSNSFGQMRLRVNNVIKVNDNLGIRTRFRAMNTKWGQDPDNNANFDWERAWMYAKTDFGILEVGRMQGGTWGTSFIDNEIDADRIKLTLPVGPVTLLAIYQKSAELDDNFAYADSDVDVLYGAGVWKSENMSAGLLVGWIKGKSGSDYITTDYLGNPAGTIPLGGNRFTQDYWAFLPFFTGKFGPFGIQAEGRWDTGTSVEYVDPEEVTGKKDAKAKGYAYNVEGTFDFGMGAAQLGYAYTRGNDPESSDNEFMALGDDWEKLFILTGSTGAVSDRGALGGYGNFSSSGGNKDGLKLLYGGANFKPMENLDLGFLLGWGKSDQTDYNQSNDLGWEIDFIAKYTIFDNLTNTFKVAYLGAGDYWKGDKYDYARSEDFDSDVWAVFNELKLSF
jgi:hypothetical protein